MCAGLCSPRSAVLRNRSPPSFEVNFTIPIHFRHVLPEVSPVSPIAAPDPTEPVEPVDNKAEGSPEPAAPAEVVSTAAPVADSGDQEEAPAKGGDDIIEDVQVETAPNEGSVDGATTDEVVDETMVEYEDDAEPFNSATNEMPEYLELRSKASRALKKRTQSAATAATAQDEFRGRMLVIIPTPAFAVVTPVRDIDDVRSFV